jgi:hypothetical protein
MNLSIQKLSFESLATVDGGSLNEQFENALKRASLDCQSRPGESKGRVITLKVTATPIVDQNGFCEEAKWCVDVTDKIPCYKSPEFMASLRRDGSFVFTEDSVRANPSQGRLDYGDMDMDDE